MSRFEPLTAAQMSDVLLLRELNADVRELLRPHLSTCDYRQGESILKEGEYLDGAYYVINGRVEARAPDSISRLAAGGDPGAMVLEDIPLSVKAGSQTTIEPGDIFGEGSALSRFPIVVAFHAITDVKCLLIRTPGLHAMFEVPELVPFKAEFDRRYRARTLRTHLQRAAIFADLDFTIIETLISRAELVTFKPGRPIAIEGSPCDAFYLVRGGYVGMSVRSGEADVTLSYLRVGDWVGEAALLLDEPWPYSLTAIEHVELVKISQVDLRRLVPSAPQDPRLWDALITRLQQRGRAVANPLSARAVDLSATSGLIHGESVLLIDLEKCTRCDECVRACADTHDGIPRFVREGPKFLNFSVATACYHCTDPVCMIGCPTGAITRPLGTFEVAIDRDTCIGCGNCVRRCPWDNILTVPYDSPKVGECIDLATKCDLCIGRPAGPACVQMCPQGCAERVNFKDEDRLASLFSTER